MSKFLTLALTVGLVFGLTGCIDGDKNRSPYVPSISLPEEAMVNEEVKIVVRSVDPDRDELVYRIRFGDGDEAWSAYHPSGQEVTFTHKYKEALSYGVKVRAFDRKAVSEWSEEKWIKIKTSEPPPQRMMSILWMGCEKWIEEFGGTHLVSFHSNCWPWWYEEHPKVKLIMYFKYKTIPEIENYVRLYKDHPNNGGYWTIAGHEPDITGANLKLRAAQYKAIRAIDPDIVNHPVITFYDCTGASDTVASQGLQRPPGLERPLDYEVRGWPGWENAFPKPDDDPVDDAWGADIYPNRCDGKIDYEGLERAANNLVTIGLERSRTQFFPVLGAFVKQGCQAASLIEQWEWWQEWYMKQEGEKLRGVAFYFSGSGSSAAGVYENERLREEAMEINRRLGLLK